MENENNPTAQEAEVPAPVDAAPEGTVAPENTEPNATDGVGDKAEATPEETAPEAPVAE